MTSAAEDSSASPDGELESVQPSDAFGDLGNEVRTSVLQHLFENDRDGPIAFSELFESNPADTTAGFAYHLRQLAGRYVRKTDDVSESDDSEVRGTSSHGGYELTYAGRRAAREVAAGSYTESHDVDVIAIEDPCPFCEREGLVATGTDNHVTVACAACERGVLTLPFPPGGHRTDDPTDLLAAFDRHHRHRLAAMSDGSCPECAAQVAASVERVGDGKGEETEDDSVRLELDCPECGCRLRCPVTLAVLDHPAVVAFYHDHDRDARERPIWNVGTEWGERLLSEDPFCVLVTCRLEGEVLELYVSQDLSVVETRRRDAE